MRSIKMLYMLALLAAVGIFVASCGEMNKTTAPQLASNDSTSIHPPRPGAEPHRLHPDPRTAFVYELFYSLNQGYGGRSTKMINGCNVSDWNYLATDPNAHNVIKARYPSPYGSSFTSFYSDLNAYGMAYIGGIGWVGRGGQCKGFIDRELYRSSVYQSGLATYSTYIADYRGSRRMTKPISQVQVGDVIMTNSINGHVAGVVQILARDAAGKPTLVDVIDSNFVGNEIIGRHPIGYSGSGASNLGNYFCLVLPYQ